MNNQVLYFRQLIFICVFTLAGSVGGCYQQNSVNSDKQAVSEDGSASIQVKPPENSDQAAKLYKLGKQSYEQGDKNKAIEYLTQSLQLNPQNADASVDRG